MSIRLDAIPCDPMQTKAWLDLNDPIVPPGATFVAHDTGEQRANYTLSETVHWSELPPKTKGDKGDPGPSNYERAVAVLGYVGTEEEYLNDAENGAKGAPGAAGDSFQFVKGSVRPTVLAANTLYGVV